MNNQPTEIIDNLPAFIDNPLSIEIKLEPGVSVVTPVTAVIGIDGYIQDMDILVTYADSEIDFTVTPEQLRQLPFSVRKKSTIYIRFDGRTVFTIPIQPTIDGSVPQPRSVQIFAPGYGIVRTSIYDEKGFLQRAETAAEIAEASNANKLTQTTIAASPGIDPLVTAFQIMDTGKSGVFKLDPSDNTSVDDGALVLVRNDKRFKRLFEGFVSAAWFGLVGDGVTDETAIWQRLLDDTRIQNIYFPKPKVSYRLKSINFKSNKTLTFEDNTDIIGTGQLSVYQRMIYLTDVNNVIIKGNNVNFKDLKANYPGINPPINSQRHIFVLQGCNNILFDGISARDSGGDGIYIGSTANQNFCSNVRLINFTADNNKRQGLSLVSGKNIDVINCRFSGTKDDTPGAGIDIEPNLNTEFLQNIRIINTTTINNEGGGILIALAAMKNTLNPVSIYVSGHYDNGSRYGFLMGYGIGVCAGSVIVESPVWENSIYNSLIVQNYSIDYPKVTFKDPKSINANTVDSVSEIYGAAMLVFREANLGGAEGSPFIGNIELINPEIVDNRAVKKVRYGIKMQDLNVTLNPTQIVKKCKITNPKFVGVPDYQKILPLGEVSVRDDTEEVAVDIGNLTRSVSPFSYASLYHNRSTSSQGLINLAKVNVGFPEVVFEMKTSVQMIIRPAATDNILPISNVVGKGIYSVTPGSRIVLIKKLDNSWFVKEMIGTWIVEP